MRAIALLRGINVGGHKIIPMVKLKTIFESAGFKNVATFIQSGNVLFDTTISDTEKLRAMVEKMLTGALGYDVPTIIRSADEMKRVVTKNPFVDEHVEKKTKYYVMFLEKKPTKSEQQSVLATQIKGMDFRFGKCELYCLLDAKFSGNDSPFANVQLEKLLGQKGTTRNWATTTKLAALIDSRLE
jgi:uncharacterized protein (DUF1697 family)